MKNNKIALYKDGRQANLVKSNNDSNQTDIVQSDGDSQVNILETLTPEQLQECKRIHNHALVHCGDYAREIKETGLSTEDRAKIAAASRAEKPTTYLKEDGVLQARFPNESNSSRTKSKSKKKGAKEEQQIATDNLILELKTQKQVIEDYLSKERLGEPEQEIIKDILDEEAAEYSTYEDIEPILKNYLIYLKQKIESLDEISRDNDYRKRIHKAKAYKRDQIRKDEAIQAVLWSWNGKVPTLERIAEYIIERDNDTRAKELLALNQYQGNIAELIEVFVIPRGQIAIGEYHDRVQMMLVPIDANIEEFVAAQNPNLVPYLHPAYEESNDRYALTAFSPVNNLPVDISKDDNNTLSTDGFNGYESINPNNQLLLEQAKVQSNITEAKLLGGASDVKQLLPAADSDDDSDNSSAIVLADSDNDSDNSRAIVLAGDKDISALDIIPTTVSTLDVLDTDKEVLSLTLTNPARVLRKIIIEDNLEERNNSGWIVKSTGEEVFHSSCKDHAAKVVRNTEKIKPLFFGQLVEGDGSYYDHVNNVTRVFINETGETVTYKGLVKLVKFASDEEIAIDEDKVLEATIKNAANAVQITEYDGPSLQSLKNDYQLTVANAEDIIRSYWNIEQNNKIRAKNTILSDKEYGTYCESKSYGTESNIIRESDLLSVSESSIKSLKDFLEYAGNDSSSESVAIKELETLLSEISKEQTQILNTPPEEIPDLILAMTNESNEVRDIVTGILQKHYKCDVSVAQEMCAIYPAIETVLEIGTSEDEEGNEIFNLPSDIWTNEDYRYEEWNGQRDLLPFPSKQEYKKFIGFIKNIEGNEDGLESASSMMLMWKLESVLDLMASNDLEAVKELQTEIDNAAVAKARRKIEDKEMESESLSQDDLVSKEMESTLEDATQELLDIDIHLDNDIQNDSEGELDDVGFIDPSLNISSKDLEILEDILQNKLNNQRLPLRHKMFWKNHFKSIPYEQVDAETISKKIEKARKLLHRS